MRPFKNKPDAATWQPSLDEELDLILGDEDELIARYGTLEAARARYRLLVARGLFSADQEVTVQYLTEEVN
jgi:hypothetical protein